MIILDAHTDYSFMRGFGTPEQWLNRAKAVGVKTLGIADYCSTWGHAPFQKAFKGSGIKLLYGVQIPVVSLLDKDPRHSLVTLIAKASTDELYAAMTQAQSQTYYRPRLTWRQVGELKDCVVIINELLRSQVRSVPSTAFAAHSLEHDLKLPRVLAYGPCYPTPEDHVGFEIFQAASENHRIGEISSEKFHLLTQGEQNSRFDGYWPSTMAEIDAVCIAEPPHGKLLDMGVQGNKAAKLGRMAIGGALKLGLAGMDQGDTYPRFFDDSYYLRLEEELAIIADKKFEDYFFFVAEIIGWAKERMFVGPGRGSAGGSLLCYLLGITMVDPLQFGTLFERFIDVTRSDLPDIDIDFPDTRREEVFDYMKQRWGAAHVARLGTLSLLGGKSAINMVARATEVPFEASREIGKFTEGAGQGITISPQWIFDHVQEVQPILARYPSLRLASVVDGHVSHHGVHASGVVVTDDPVRRYGTVDKLGILSMDMRTAEDIGLVKLDALGLRTLSVIQETCDLIGIDPKTLYNLDWNDKTILDGVFNADHVTGIFQFEGHATRNLMKQVRVDRFDDLCALTSLSRPGPLVGGAAGGWVKARNGEAVGAMLHPALEETYGVICYQEQFMWIARDVAGFDIPQVNGMRRAVSKKDPEKLRGYRDAFITGSTAKLGADRAAELWEEICEFGSYAFNKAHAVAYSMISFMTAHLKHTYPLQFAVAQLRNAADDDQIKNLLRELTEEGYKYVPFDAERSAASWSIRDGVLFGGFDSIRGIGTKTADRLIVARDSGRGGWLDKLTDAQRIKIEKAELRWTSISYFSEKYVELYKNPDTFRSENTPKGIKPPVFRIKDIPDAKGNYAFIGRITKLNVVDDDAPDRVAKRDGKKRGKDHTFINVSVEDDTGEISGTINRFKYDQFQWLVDLDRNGKDFLFRGNIIESGRRWLFYDNVIELK
jgi:DNA polymerase III alpha subunit